MGGQLNATDAAGAAPHEDPVEAGALAAMLSTQSGVGGQAGQAWRFPLCPEGPPWSPDWADMVGRFDWIQAMRGVPQHPEYHAEGDVLTHTGMVVEALAGLAAWQALGAEERSILFAAALLHDVGKPACTQIEPDGSIRSRGHARRGAGMARQILWEREQWAPFVAREMVVGLVRHHGLPVFFLEKQDPRRALIAASLVVRLDRLALLAEADVRGRRCRDQQELLGRIELFRAYAAELGCLEEPYAFASAHSRFIYFRKEHGDPAYAAYDDTRCTVVLMSGLPGAGKDHWIREQLAGWPVISLDALRDTLGVEPEERQGAVVKAAKEQARAYLRAGVSFVWNATNTTRLMRGRSIELFAAYKARVHIVYVDAPLLELLARNAARPAGVPERVIRKLAASLEVPDLTEAHEVETLCSW